MQKLITISLALLVATPVFALPTSTLNQSMDKTRIDIAEPITAQSVNQTIDKAKSGTKSLSEETSALQTGNTTCINSLSTSINDQRQFNPGFPNSK